MKKMLTLFSAIAVLLLAACSAADRKTPIDLHTSSAEADTDKKEVTELARNNSFRINGLGKVQVLKVGTGKQETLGSLHMNIGRVSVVKVTLNENIQKRYLDKEGESMTAVVIDIKSTNSQEKPLVFSPGGGFDHRHWGTNSPGPDVEHVDRWRSPGRADGRRGDVVPG